MTRERICRSVMFSLTFSLLGWLLIATIMYAEGKPMQLTAGLWPVVAISVLGSFIYSLIKKDGDHR
ncbi:hypothetical protein [Flavisphingopyxis soli]|uniref:hypothetical protein n=1 Tax=Flavisphingopyxis soli TaxID=2601267 RepID=UPI0013755B6F|nr:hypothetical protein [Sphingorhabdus soli]